MASAQSGKDREPVRITTPLTDESVAALRAGDRVLISGVLITARDAAHKRLVECLDRGDDLPFDIRGQVIYYVGPTPARPGQVIGSAGPTTAYRMDAFTPRLLAEGLKGAIAKGARSAEVIEAFQRYRGVYLAATGGAAALLSKRIVSCEVIAYDDLGPEAVRRLVVEDFPVIVVNDIHGEDYYRTGPREYLAR